MKFVAQRQVRTDGTVRRWVDVASSSRATPRWVCLESFRKVFGFTPRKGKAYEIEMADVEIREIDRIWR